MAAWNFEMVTSNVDAASSTSVIVVLRGASNTLKLVAGIGGNLELCRRGNAASGTVVNPSRY